MLSHGKIWLNKSQYESYLLSIAYFLLWSMKLYLILCVPGLCMIVLVVSSMCTRNACAWLLTNGDEPDIAFDILLLGMYSTAII